MTLFKHLRREFLAAALGALLTAKLGKPAGPVEPRIVVVTETGVEAYGEALRGFELRLKSAARVVDLSDGAALKSALAPSPVLVVALGSGALTALADSHSDAPVLLSMVLDEATRGAKLHLAGSVHLDMALSQVLDEVAALFPGKTRVTIICNPRHPWVEAPSSTNVRQQGFTIQSVECSSAEDLLRTFLFLRGKTDFVVALPDSTLYNSATIRPLILASLENRLPLIGFSAAFVRSGASMGVYADFEDIGQQTAETAQRIMTGQSQAAHEGPRRHITAVNQRVLRLLGMDYKQREGLVVYK
jgi:putative ABC transport system substrate-binding protein